VYFLRSPLATYLSDRGKQIRGDLVKAAEMKHAAAAELAQIDARMAALPGELEALRKAGAEEVAAEDARIREAAGAERARLIEQARRDIDWQLKIAERDLQKHAAALAIELATARVKATITEADQVRLVDRYVAQVGG
jgi:F-type H+-transporting ATPase subunit b